MFQIVVCVGNGKVHANSSSNAFASFRSRVSKPSVNHPYRSQQFARASRNAKLVAIEGAGHFELIDPRSFAWPEVLKNMNL